MKVLVYVQHLLGIGHLARVSRIAAAMEKAGLAVTLVSGGAKVQGFPPANIRLVQLPPIRARDTAFSALVDQDDQPLGEGYKERRRDLLLAEFSALRPDALVVEAFPFGRRQMRFELIPLLDAAKTLAKPPIIAASVRDILQENKKPGRAEETIDLVRTYFDVVFVHGDPDFVRLEETFPQAAQIAGRVVYTGLVAGDTVMSHERFDAVVSAGGGVAGAKLIEAAIEAARVSGAEWPRWCIITGPNFPQAETARLQTVLPRGVSLSNFRPDFAGLLGQTRISVSQAGYNTVCDILRAGCPAVLIPFAEAGETEQTLRAGRLHSLGLAEALSEERLSAETLLAAMRRAPRAPKHGIDLEGAGETARVLGQALLARN